jgi:hypothetical protein
LFCEERVLIVQEQFMNANMDVEKIDETIRDEELIRIIRQKPDEATLLASLKELARRKSPGKLQVFGEVVADPQQSMRAKRAVINDLGTERLPQNQAMLLEQLPVLDATLFSGIVRSLGKIGDEEALRRLEEIEAPDVTTARESLEFARSLMAYRLRLDRHLIPPPPASSIVHISEGVEFETTRAKADTVRLANEQVRKDLPAIPLAQTGAVSLSCRTNELILAFHDEFRQAKALRTILQRPSLPMVLLKRGLSLDRFILEGYFFTQPSKDSREVVLLGVRPSGELTYAGKIQITEGEFTFSLSAVDTRYAPAIEVEGSYDTNKRAWNFSKAVTSLNVAARQNQPETPRKNTPNFNRR